MTHDFYDRFRKALLQSAALSLGVVGATGISMVNAKAWAQTNNDTAADDTDDSGFDAIVVTARQRKESLLDISASISVLDEDTIERFELDEFENVADFLPNVTFNSAPSGTPVLAVRGIGTRAGGAFLEQDVGLFIDGVWAGRQNQLPAAQFDLERIELLRGTQSTLYGRNTLVGAVSVTSRRPTDEFEGYLSGGYEFVFDSTVIEGAVSVPVTENFGLRFSGRYNDRGGFVENLTLNRDEPQREEIALRVIGVYETDSGIEAVAKFQYADQEQVGNPFVRLAAGTFTEFDGTRTVAPAPVPASALLGFNEVAFGTPIVAPILGNEDVGATRDFIDSSLQLNIPIGEHVLTSITGFSTLQFRSVFDPTILAGPRLIAFADEDYQQFTQEIRLTSPGGRDFDYIIGAFYVDQNIDRLDLQYLNAADRFFFAEQRLTGFSFFASGTYSLADNLRIVGGARLSLDRKDADIIVHGNTNADLDFAQDSDTADTDILDGSLTIEFDASDDVLLFAGVAKGSKSPGLASGNPVANADFANPGPLFIPTATNYSGEVGAKISIPGGYINLTGFYMEIDGFQQATFTNGNLQIDSIDIRSFGLEADAFFRFSDRFSANLGLGYQNVQNLDAPVGEPSDLPGAPAFSANGVLSYEQPDIITGLNGFANLNVNYTSSHFLNAAIGAENAFNEIDAVTLVNLTFGVLHVASGIEFSFIGRNLTNQDFADFSFNAPGPSNDFIFGVAEPRTLAIRAKISF